MTLTRRQTLIGAAATVAAAAMPALGVAVADDYVLTPAVAKLLADMVSGSACRRKELMS
jgi:hypothetical protein